MIFTLPNCISILRMVGTLCLLGTAPLSAPFYAIYTLTGVTDVLDGWVARKTGTCSSLAVKSETSFCFQVASGSKSRSGWLLSTVSSCTVM